MSMNVLSEFDNKRSLHWLGWTRCGKVHFLSSFWKVQGSFSHVLNWSLLCYWNQWHITGCSPVIHHFFSISVKRFDFFLFQITSERLYNLSGFIIKHFSSFLWKSHTVKNSLLSKWSFTSIYKFVPVLQYVLYLGLFNWNIYHTLE